MENNVEKRMLLAIVFSVLVYVLYGYYSTKNLPPAPAPAPAPVKVEPAATAPPPVPEKALPEIQIKEGEKIDVTVESPLYRAVISNTGGLVRSWKLKKYQGDAGEPEYEMVPHYFPSPTGQLFQLDIGDERINQEINLSTYAILNSGTNRGERSMNAPADLSLAYQRPGLRVVKDFHFDDNNYLVSIRARVTINGKDQEPRIILGPAIGDSIPKKDNTKVTPEVILRANGKLDRIPLDKVENGKTYTVSGLAGLETYYFANVFLPSNNKNLFTKKYHWKENAQNKEIVSELPIVEIAADPNATQAYVGPKDYQSLKKVDPSLTELINYGVFSFIVKGFLFVLQALYAFVHNYGVAIILFTFIITLALYPLRYKQMVSMKKMQKLQPRIKAIQDKYKTLKVETRQKQEMMQKEIMELHRQHGVNPLETLGGCLLLLPQLPIFYAFYNLLAYSIELRHAPFAFWIKDLSDKDPYYIMPVMMGLSMLLQYKLTPTAVGADPAQQTQAKIMGLVFPVFLTFIFLNMSSGLNLYFLFSNLFGILLQKITERWIPQDRAFEPQQVIASPGKK